MAESSVITLDDFSDGGAKWQFWGGSGVGHSLSTSATRAGTALGNVAGVRTLGYTFTSTTGTDASLKLTLPVAADISAAQYLCCDLITEPGLAANITLLSVQLQTAGGNKTFGPSFVQDGMWLYCRLPLAGLVGVDLTHVQAILINLHVNAGTAGALEVDTVRACDYQYSAADYAYYGRNSSALLPATAEAQGAAARQYLFGSTSGIAAAASGYEGDPAKVNYGALIGWNQWTGHAAEVALDDESDHTYNTGHVIAALCLWYRMTSDTSYLTQAAFLVQQYAERHYDQAAGHGKGFIAYSYDRSNAWRPQSNPSTSTDQYQGLLLGLTEYWIVTGRNDPTLLAMVQAMQAWWDDAAHTDPAGGASPPPSNQKPPLIDAVAGFMNSGDATAADTSLAGEFGGNNYQAGQQAYQLGWLGAANSFYNLYSLLVYVEDILRCRLRRTKVGFPVDSVETILQQNLLFAWGFGSNNYYATDMPGDFGKRPLGWAPVEGVTWDGTAKRLQVTAAGPLDQWDLSGAAYVGYLGPILQALGGDVAALIAAGNSTSLSALSLMTTVMETYATAAINNPALAGTPVAGALPRYAIGPYGAYTGQVDAGRGNKMPLIDEQPNHLYFASYAWWYLWTQFAGLWPSGAADRVLDWRYSPALGTLRLTVNGTPGDRVAVPISGMASGHTYRLQNVTTGAAPNTQAGGGATYTLSWTLTQPEETWVIGDVASMPALATGSGPAPVLSLVDLAAGDAPNSPLTRGLGSAVEVGGNGPAIGSATAVA